MGLRIVHVGEHVVFGIVMGNVYGRLIQRDRQRARAMSGMAAAH